MLCRGESPAVLSAFYTQAEIFMEALFLFRPIAQCGQIFVVRGEKYDAAVRHHAHITGRDGTSLLDNQDCIPPFRSWSSQQRT